MPIRGLYYNECRKQRFLTVRQTASVCGVSVTRIVQWISSGILDQAEVDRDFVEVADLLWFLIRNDMPISARILPPRTAKLLFVGDNAEALLTNEALIADVSKALTGIYELVLTESCVAGAPANLTILTFSPHFIALFDKQNWLDISRSCELLGDTTIKSILFAGYTTKIAIDNGFMDCPTDLVLRNDLPSSELELELQQLVG